MYQVKKGESRTFEVAPKKLEKPHERKMVIRRVKPKRVCESDEKLTPKKGCRQLLGSSKLAECLPFFLGQ